MIYCDNQNIITLIKNLQFYIYIKYIDIQYYYVREQIIIENITLEYIFTKR